MRTTTEEMASPNDRRATSGCTAETTRGEAYSLALRVLNSRTQRCVQDECANSADVTGSSIFVPDLHVSAAERCSARAASDPQSRPRRATDKQRSECVVRPGRAGPTRGRTRDGRFERIDSAARVCPGEALAANTASELWNRDTARVINLKLRTRN